MSTATTPNRILFASCNSQHYEQPLWPHIVARQPTAFVWGGDAIYADDFYVPSPLPWPLSVVYQKKEMLVATPEKLRLLYNEQCQHDGYQKLLRRNITVMGAIDDHDFGANNGDSSFQHRTQSAEEYVRFLQSCTTRNGEESTLMEQRARAGQGVYAAKVFDFGRVEQPLLTDAQAGVDGDLTDFSNVVALSNRSVAIFTLDVRTHKTPWRKDWKRFLADYEADFLGAAQWQWLVTGLRRSTATVNVIVQGLQVHADRFWDGNKVEDWSRFPTARHRLYQALLQHNVSVPVLVSGDVHMAELLRKDCRRPHDQHARLLLEVTTSGMTHSWGTRVCARPHSGWSCRTPYVDWAMKMGMTWAHNNFAWRDLLHIDNRLPREGAKRGFQYALDLNFAEFEFDWEHRQLLVRVLGQDAKAPPLVSTRWDFDVLSGRLPAPPNGDLRSLDFARERQTMMRFANAVSDDFICLPYRGPQTHFKKLWGFVGPVSLATFLLALPVVLPALLGWCVLLRRRKGCRL